MPEKIPWWDYIEDCPCEFCTKYRSQMSQAVSTTSNNTSNMETFSGGKNPVNAKGDAKNANNWLKNEFGTVLRDARGRPIAKGKTIVYVTRQGSSIRLKFAKVTGFENGKVLGINKQTKKKVALMVQSTTRMIAIS